MDLALFDFDGTITDRETMADFMSVAVRPARLRLGKVLLSPLIAGYKAKLLSPSLLRAAICWVGFRGVPLHELQAIGAQFARDSLPARLRPEAMARIAWHKARGDVIVVVSGSLDVYLEHWCRSHGLALICSSLQQRCGRLSGFYRGLQCVGAEKARRVMRRFPPAGYPRVFAYGDTPEDRELLGLADEAYYRWQLVDNAGGVDSWPAGPGFCGSVQKRRCSPAPGRAPESSSSRPGQS